MYSIIEIEIGLNMTTALRTWLTIGDLSKELGIPKQTIYRWRTEGKGPRAHKLGSHVRFAREDVDAWLADSADPKPAA